MSRGLIVTSPAVGQYALCMLHNLWLRFLYFTMGLHYVTIFSCSQNEIIHCNCIPMLIQWECSQICHLLSYVIEIHDLTHWVAIPQAHRDPNPSRWVRRCPSGWRSALGMTYIGGGLGRQAPSKYATVKVVVPSQGSQPSPVTVL